MDDKTILFKYLVGKSAFGKFVSVLSKRRFCQTISALGFEQEQDQLFLFFNTLLCDNASEVKIITKDYLITNNNSFLLLVNLIYVSFCNFVINIRFLTRKRNHVSSTIYEVLSKH